VLGVPANATREQVRAAYRSLARKHHPDKGGDPAIFVQINAAHTAMIDKLTAMGSFDDIFDTFSREFRNARA